MLLDYEEGAEVRAASQLFKVNLVNDVRSSAAIGAGGELYVGSDNNRLYAIGQ